jgi:hypothetical protein
VGEREREREREREISSQFIEREREREISSQFIVICCEGYYSMKS